jgi:type II secretory pathway pseudopilin PulG
LEILVILAVIGILAALTWDPGVRMIKRYRMEGRVHQVAAFLERAKSEAVKRGVPVVVKVEEDLANGTEELVSFADVDDAAGNPTSDLLYNPDNSLDPFTGQPKTRGATDYEIQRFDIGQGAPPDGRIYLWSQDQAAPGTQEAVVGFTTNPEGVDEPNIIVFDSDGSVRAQGGLRFGMGPQDYDGSGGIRNNFMEVRVAPRTTARVEIRKFVPEPAGVAGYYPSNATPEGEPWKWY